MTELFSGEKRSVTPFELQALMALPCGCVVADFRARTLAVDLISLEAKGPRCTLETHAAGDVLGLGECVDLAGEGVERPVS